MKYPQLPENLDRRRKIKSEDLERMKELRKLGLTYKQIGEAVGIEGSTVGYHLNPTTKINTIERVKRDRKYRWENDPEFRERALKNSRTSKKYIRKVNHKMNIYTRQFD